jgi:hypothetical protein
MLGRVSYMGTLTNGQGPNAADVNDAKSLAGRVEVQAAENLRLGVFGGLHDHPDLLPAVDDSDYGEAFGADFELGTWRNGFHVLAGIAAGNNWRLGPDVDFLAAQLLASWYAGLGRPLLAGIEPLFRLSWADPDRDVEDAGGLLLTPGVMLYFEGRNGVSVNLDSYSPDGDRGSEWSLKAQAFLYF